jgi:hypothetical protein
MKNFTVKASALAIAAALPGLASAAIDIDAGTGAATYASELIPATVSAGVAIVLDPATAELGFGVSAGQDRYIRFDLTGAKWDTAGVLGGASTDLEVASNCGTTNAGAATETVVQGGAANGTSVIFQITAVASAGIPADASVCLDVGSVKLISAAGATLKYSLYSTPADAVTGLAAGRLATATGSIADSAPALVYDVTPGVSTANVASGYVDFVSDPGANSTTVIGSVLLTTDSNVVDLNGGAVTLSDLITDANWVVTGEDLASLGANAASNSGIFYSTTSCATVGAAGTFLSATSRRINSGTLDIDGDFCYRATGAIPITEQDFTTTIDLTAANGATVSDVSAQALGSFERNGTVLKAPIMSGVAGQNTWIQVANVSSTAAPWTVQCFGPAGALGAGASSTLPAGTTGKLFYNSLGCPAGANAVELIINAPGGNVVGTLVRQSTTTGDSGLDSLTGNE